MHLKQVELASDAAALALDAAHSVAFHTGLGSPLYPALSTPTSGYIDQSAIAAFASAAYTKPNISLVADGASQGSLSKYVEHFFKDVPATSTSSLSLNTASTKYFGGESRTGLAGGNALVIAFPGSSYASFKPELSVLTALLGGESAIKWAPGFSLLSKAIAGTPKVTAKSTNFTYSDAGLFAVEISGSAASVRSTAEAVVKSLKAVAEGSVSKEDLAKAVAKAKFDALEGTQLRGAGLIAAGSGILHAGTPFQVTEAVKAIESVSADKIKSVGNPSSGNRLKMQTNTILSRRSRAFWTERPQSQRWVTSMSFPTRRIWALRYRERRQQAARIAHVSTVYKTLLDAERQCFICGYIAVCEAFVELSTGSHSSPWGAGLS